MPDVTFTAVRTTDTTQFLSLAYGATIAIGDILYIDPADTLAKLADCDAADADIANAKYLALTPGINGGHGLAAFGGEVELVGATMTGGDSQVLSGTAGKIQQDVDLASSDYISPIGRALSATRLKLAFDPTGEQVA